MKRIFLVILLIFSLSFSFGFVPKSQALEVDNFIMLSLDFSLNGEIKQSIDFSVNSEMLTNESLSVKELLDFRKALIKEVETIRNEFLFSFALVYMKNPVEDYKINKGVLFSPVVYQEENDTIGFQMSFSSVKAWNYYHSSLNEETNKVKPNKNIFLNKIESESLFPFSAEIETKDNEKIIVGQRYKQIYIESAKSLSFYDKIKKMYKPVFIYNYSSYNRKLHSDSSFTYIDNNRHFHHVWMEKEETLTSGKTIKLAYYSIEKGIWLIFAITIPLVVMIISIIIIKIKDKKKV